MSTAVEITDCGRTIPDHQPTAVGPARPPAHRSGPPAAGADRWDTGSGPEIRQVSTGRVLVNGYCRARAALDVNAELMIYRDGSEAYVALAVSGDACVRETVTLDVEEAARLAEALTRAVRWHRSGCPTDGPIGGGR